MTLKESLLENKSIRLQVEAKTWQEAVKATTDPLVEAGAIEQRYYDEIILGTEKLGPYYILAPGLAMPHARPDGGVIRDSFSFVTLKEPVDFGSELGPVDILITLAATSADIHAGEAIPQIVDIFDDEENFEKIRVAKTVEEILEIIG